MLLQYNFSLDRDDIVYSIDMLYIRGFLLCSCQFINNLLIGICSSHKSFKGRSKYSWFQDMFLFDGITIYTGLFDEYNNINNTWVTLPYAEIRFNPNKHMESDVIKLFFDNVCDSTIRKFDFACDVPCKPSRIIVNSRRKYSSLNNGETRYFGSWGYENHIKVYNKSKELFDNKKIEKDVFLSNDLTRIELTIKTSCLDTFVSDKFYLLSDLLDYDGLKDTDKCILDLFYKLKCFQPDLSINDLNLGRGKSEKLKPFLIGESKQIEFSKDICILLLDKVCQKYECSY